MFYRLLPYALAMGSKTNMEFRKTNEEFPQLYIGKNFTNQKSLTPLGNKLVIAGALVQHAKYCTRAGQ